MKTYEVIESLAYVHPQKDYQVSFYGAHPGPGWEVKCTGYTVYNNRTGTSGACRMPWKTREDAQKWTDEQNERLEKLFSNSSAS